MTRRVQSLVALLVTLVTVGLVLLAAGWAFTGGRWLIVRTPSMGRTAPVGTLLWTRPVHELHVGQIISFHPPAEPSTTYTHRIHAIAADGTITTKGDGNLAVDPWQLHRSDVSGVVAMRWYAVGWLIRAAPLVVFGAIALYVLARYFTGPRWRLPAVIMGAAAIVTAWIVVYRPLISAELVVFDHVDSAATAARATYVSTGLLPVRVSSGDESLVLRDGQFGTVLAKHVGADGRFSAHVGPALTWWMWAALIAACFAPAVWTAVANGRAPRRIGAHAAR